MFRKAQQKKAHPKSGTRWAVQALEAKGIVESVDAFREEFLGDAHQELAVSRDAA